jgi:hypothetical protein
MIGRRPAEFAFAIAKREKQIVSVQVIGGRRRPFAFPVERREGEAHCPIWIASWKEKPIIRINPVSGKRPLPNARVIGEREKVFASGSSVKGDDIQLPVRSQEHQSHRPNEQNANPNALSVSESGDPATPLRQNGHCIDLHCRSIETAVERSSE